ncbi:MAG: hypothetical protein R3Y60_01855 [bacterium]
MLLDERLTLLSKNVRIEIGINNNVSDELIIRYCEKGINIASEVTFYDVASLPIMFNESIINAVVETIQKRNNEGLSNFSNISGSYTYSYQDMEQSLRKKLRNKRNPMSLVGKF